MENETVHKFKEEVNSMVTNFSQSTPTLTLVSAALAALVGFAAVLINIGFNPKKIGNILGLF